MAGHAQLKFVMTECSKTQIRLTGLIFSTDLNDLEKKLAKNIKPKLKIWVEPDGETIVHKFNVGIIKDTVRFKLGEEQEKEYLGHKGKVSISVSANKINPY